MSIMRRLSVAVFPLLLITACDSQPDSGSGQPSAGSLEEGMVNPGYEEKPDWFANSFLDIREDVSE
ncbi:MAG: hypothetical protein KAJ06_05175, partial [Gammaproteobacteria bacterium]|nr:hypothetical protein [Gammaproteobacteria bacterium]